MKKIAVPQGTFIYLTIHDVQATGTGCFKPVLRLEGVHLPGQRFQPPLVLRRGLRVGADDGGTGAALLRLRAGSGGRGPQRSHGKIAVAQLGQEILELSIYMTCKDFGRLAVETPGNMELIPGIE